MMLTRTLLLTLMVGLFNLAETAAQYFSTGFDTPAEQNEWTQFRTGFINTTYFWDFDQASSISGPTSLVHYYPVGGSDTLDDWFVSPAFDFSNGGSVDSLWQNFGGFGLPNPGDTIGLYILNGSNDPTLASNISRLILFTDTSYQNNNTWNVRTGITIPAQSGQSYLAFRYKTVVNWLDVRFDNLVVTGATTGISSNEKQAKALKVFPNPTRETITIELPKEVTPERIELFDLTGNMVAEFSAAQTTFDLDGLNQGSYFLKVISADAVLTKTIVKY